MNALETLRKASRMLARVSTAGEAKKLMDLASAAEYFARKMKLGEESVRYAHRIQIDAQAKLGEFLAQAQKNTGAKGSIVTGSVRVPVKDDTPTLADLGLTKRQSAEAQFLQEIKQKSPEEFHRIRAGEKSVTEVRREVSRAKVVDAAQLPSDKYRVIYADPPWRYNDQLTDSYGPTEFHYPSMSMNDLRALPVADLCEDNAVLFLWTTAPMLPEALDLTKAWFFDYKTHFIWDKVKHNMGHYNSVRHELLLVCVRGSCTPDVPKLFDSVQSIERTEHSVKPAEFRTIIDTLYPYGRRIELFARQAADGWERWGNQLLRQEKVRA